MFCYTINNSRPWRQIFPVVHGKCTCWSHEQLRSFLTKFSEKSDSRIKSSSAVNGRKSFWIFETNGVNYCIKLSYSNSQIGEINLFMRNINGSRTGEEGTRFDTFPVGSTTKFTEIGKFIRRVDKNGDGFSVFNSFGLKKESLYMRGYRMLGKTNFLSLISSFEGYSICILQRDNPFPASRAAAQYSVALSELTKKTGGNFTVYLKYYCWLAPYAADIFKWGRSIQLDASFLASAPFCYYIITIENHNNSIPIGFAISPTESRELYEIAFTTLYNVVYPEKIANKLFLSDMGTAIDSFLSEYDFKANHYYCYRHFLERFGTNSFLSPIVGSMIFAKDTQEFTAAVNAYKSQIRLFCKRSHIDLTPHIKRIGRIIGEVYDPSSDSFIACDRDLYERMTLFNRLGVPTCSNHIESLHSHINARIKKNERFLNRIRTIHDYILEKYHNLRRRPSKNFDRSYNIVQNEYKNACYPVEQKEECYCNQSIILSTLYGVKFPCVHTVAIRAKPTPMNIPSINPGNPKELIVIVSDESVYGDEIVPRHQVIPQESQYEPTLGVTGVNKLISEMKKKHRLTTLQALDYIKSIEYDMLLNKGIRNDAPGFLNELRVECWMDKMIIKTIRKKNAGFYSMLSPLDSGDDTQCIKPVCDLSTTLSPDTLSEDQRNSCSFICKGFYNPGCLCYFITVIQLIIHSVALDSLPDTGFGYEFKLFWIKHAMNTSSSSDIRDIFYRFTHYLKCDGKYKISEPASAVTCYFDFCETLFSNTALNPFELYIGDKARRGITIPVDKLLSSSLQSAMDNYFTLNQPDCEVEYLSIEVDREKFLFIDDNYIVSFDESFVSIPEYLSIKYSGRLLTLRLSGYIEMLNAGDMPHYICNIVHQSKLLKFDDISYRDCGYFDGESNSCTIILYKNSHWTDNHELEDSLSEMTD